MSAGKGDKWRQTDFGKYYNAPYWANKEKKTVEVIKEAREETATVTVEEAYAQTDRMNSKETN